MKKKRVTLEKVLVGMPYNLYPELRGAEFDIVELFFSQSRKDGYCYPTYGQISKRLRLSNSTVKKTIAKLLKKGIITKNIENRRYTVVIPEFTASSLTEEDLLNFVEEEKL